MVPADFSVCLYSQDGFAGSERIYTMTDSSLIMRGDTLNIESLKVIYDDGTTFVQHATGLNANPDDFHLQQNYPNPFNPQTYITFSLTHKSHVVLNIFNLRGEMVQTLVDGVKEAGEHTAVFKGAHFPSGVYFYRLSINGNIWIRKMTLMK